LGNGEGVKNNYMSNLIPFQDERTYKYGFKNSYGSIIIAPVYNECREFSEGLAACNFGRWGFINERGDTIIPFKFFRVGDFSFGLACVNIDNIWGYINKQGKIAIKPKFSMAHDFFKDSQGNIYAIVAMPEKNVIREFVIDTNGKIMDRI
jgi:hypothetical protein